MSSSSPIGTAWTLATHANTTGLANAGRAITAGGGLQLGQTFETVIENPAGVLFYRGFDMLFTSGPDNNGPGNNTAALRIFSFNGGGSTNWKIKDAAASSVNTGLSPSTTAAAGMKLDLTLTSATTYTLTLTPLNGATPYFQAGTLAGATPITWVDFRLFDGTSTGAEDPANNFEISSMTISIVPEPSVFALIGLVSAGLLFLRRRR